MSSNLNSIDSEGTDQNVFDLPPSARTFTAFLRAGVVLSDSDETINLTTNQLIRIAKEFDKELNSIIVENERRFRMCLDERFAFEAKYEEVLRHYEDPSEVEKRRLHENYCYLAQSGSNGIKLLDAISSHNGILPLTELAKFVNASSEFYKTISLLYAARIVEWVEDGLAMTEEGNDFLKGLDLTTF
ncbi:hypothetical protein Enr10x_32020 [Gimesia panareensis]|uniref:Uncharacterized protein n=1 Tax=Gimesia panareensis TaxID=2527978 RepID=A0A517Q8C4_9PLAN|nr:hypothetical protein [Gimesia panareensis]QDT27867.1 hypothetical protein Enr10x_32020 [Gimesia panareensis]